MRSACRRPANPAQEKRTRISYRPQNLFNRMWRPAAARCMVRRVAPAARAPPTAPRDASSRSVADDRRPPREAAADAFDQHVLAALDAAVAHRDIKCERNGRRRRIAVLAHRDDHALLRQAELAAGTFDCG